MNSKILPRTISSVLSIATPLLLTASPALAGAVRDLHSGASNAYRVYLPAGNYTLTASADNGDADIAIGDLNWDPIARGRDVGDSTVRVNLNGGYYIVVLIMHSCDSWLAGCDLYTTVVQDGVEISPEFALIDSNSNSATGGSGQTRTECQRYSDGTYAYCEEVPNNGW